jgi:hypothetical protein
MPAYPKNYPFYNWVPKPIGIIILFMFFLPILTVGGTYSASGTEMMSGLGIISEHIQFANFATSIGMAAFCPFLYRLVQAGEKSAARYIVAQALMLIKVCIERLSCSQQQRLCRWPWVNI